ncbi:hypothetical protein BCR39DRAFT_473589 [Naematelia encephala]|uniref:Uncharacterized protein n=1 Tax=Naematelia encephala TaxID=71784 RepID=A0A1Y2AK96_9TREE|nr:hypothetical protein BCR39DRAFT_473589 [Naematelia encephala]
MKSSLALGRFVAQLPHKSVLQVSGPDAQKFLKGLSCKDVDSLKGGYSGFLNASGRVLHTCFIFPVDRSTYIITHESPLGHPAPLQNLLPPFKLRAKVKIRDVSEEWDAWAAWGVAGAKAPNRVWRRGSGGAAESQWSWDGEPEDLGLREGEIGCWDLRAGYDGMQLLIPKGADLKASLSADRASTSDYHLRRMTLGVPEGPDEIIPGAALPLESCMDLHGGVDFRKGCYLGQELTVRTYHTGATRKRILPVRGNIGDIRYFPLASTKSRPAGKILAMHNTGQVGLGLVRLEYLERMEAGDGFLRVEDEDIWVGRGEAYAAATS